MKRIVVIGLLGCQEAKHEPPAVAPHPVVVIDAPKVDAGTVDASGPEEIREGIGTCRKDDDCTLTNYQEGCCVQACTAYASNKRALAARQAREDCTKHTDICPPPSPCPKETIRPLRAKCMRNRCYSVVQILL